MYYQMKFFSTIFQDPIKMSSETALMKTPAETFLFCVFFVSREWNFFFFLWAINSFFLPQTTSTRFFNFILKDFFFLPFFVTQRIPLQNVLTSRATITIRHSSLKGIDQLHKARGKLWMFFLSSRQSILSNVPAAIYSNKGTIVLRHFPKNLLLIIEWASWENVSIMLNAAPYL